MDTSLPDCLTWGAPKGPPNPPTSGAAPVEPGRPSTVGASRLAPRSADVSLSSVFQPLLGVLWFALIPHFEIKTRARERAGVPDAADPLALAHVVTLLDHGLGDVGVERVVLVAVIQDDQVPVPLEPAGVDDVPGVDGGHAGAFTGLDVDTAAKGACAETRVHLGSERRHHPAVGRPREASAQGAEADTRWLDAGARRRGLGHATLTGLEILDEGFEAA